MSALARSRRHRFAPMLLLAFALLVVGGTYTALAPSSAQADALDNADAGKGEALFIANCATCHGPGAVGTDLAPSLVGVDLAAVHFQVTTGRMPMQASGPQAEAKPPQFSEDEALDMAAYIATLGPGPSIPTEEQVDPALGRAPNGMLLFRVNCAMCHNVAGAGGALTEGKWAPPIQDTSGLHIYAAMVTGPQNMPVFSDMNLSDDDKRDIISALLFQQEAVSVGGFTLGSLGPVSEGLFIWIFGIGALVAISVWITAKSN